MTEGPLPVEGMAHVLRRHWESYLRVPLEPASRHVKTERLEVFLGWALQCATDSDGPGGLPEFSDMHSVSNLLAGEFLVDVHEICSDSPDNDVGLLQRYLLDGRGSVILRVLHTIGVQGLSCSQDLAELLVSLVPVCFKFSKSKTTSETDMDLCHITECFQNSSNIFANPTSASMTPTAVATGLKARTFQNFSLVTSGRVMTDVGKSPGESTFQRLIHQQRPIRHSSGHTSRDRGNFSTTTSDSEEEFVHIRSPFKFRVTSYPLLQSNATSPLGVFPGLLGSTAGSEVDLEQAESPGKAPKWSSLEPLQLCVLLLTIVRELCHEDCFQLDNKKSVSAYMLPSMVQLFSSMHFEEDQLFEATGTEKRVMSGEELLSLKRYFIRILLSVSSYIISQTNGLYVIRSGNSLPAMLHVAVDLICKEKVQQNDRHDYVPSTVKLYLAQDIILGVWLFMEHIFANIPLNPSVLNLALRLFHDVMNHRGLGVIEGLLSLWERVLTQQEERQLSVGNVVLEPREQIEFIMLVLGRTIRFLKQAKINYIHAVKCSRQKHKKCDFRWYVHHHHDTLGLAGSKPYVPKSDSGSDSLDTSTSELEQSEPDTCAVATIGEFLLYLYQKSLSRTAQLKIVQCLEEAGVCCCMSPGAIMHVLMKNLPGHSLAVRNYTLRILVRILLEQCGGAEQVQKAKGTCHICKDEVWKSMDTDNLHPANNREVMFVVRQETSDSAFSGSDASLQEDTRSESKPPRWRVLKQLQGLVLDKQDSDMATQVMQHTLMLIIEGCNSVKQELFYCLFLPILQATKESPLSVSVPVIQHCLVGLPLLLQSPVVHTMFLNYGGVKQLCQLSKAENLRNSVLKTFQVLIILEEKKNDSASKGIEYDLQARHQLEEDIESTASDRSKVSDLDGEAEEAVEAISYASSSTTTMITSADTTSSGFKSSKALHGDSENATSAILNEFLKMLMDSTRELENFFTETDNLPNKSISYSTEKISNLLDIWNACSVLFAQSHQFKHQFLSKDGPKLSLSVLRITLSLLVQCTEIPACVPDLRGQGSNNDFTLWLALLQATLSVVLASCKVKAIYAVENLSMGEVLGYMKTTLVESALWEPDRAVAVKHICDLLLVSASVKSEDVDATQMQSITAMYASEEDWIYDRELLELTEPSSSRETDTCLTEQGYEGDSEFLPEDTQATSPRSKSSSRDNPSTLKTTDTVTYPEVCRLVVELLAEYYGKTDRAAGSTVVLPHVLLRVLALVRNNVSTAMSLYNQGLLTVLLDGFKVLLTSKLPAMQVKQKLVLELFLAIAQHAVTSTELKGFLELFKVEGVCLDNLLPTALALVKSFNVQPSHILCFPVVKTDFLANQNISQHSISSEMFNASMRHVLPGCDSQCQDSITVPSSGSQSMYNEGSLIDPSESTSFDHDLSSNGSIFPATLHHVPLHMHLRNQAMWPTAMAHKGFSVSLWLRIEPTSVPERNQYNWSRREEGTEKRGLWDILGSIGKKCALPDRLKVAMKRHMDSRHWSNQCLHVLSVGNELLRFEVWTEPHVTNLIFRIVTHSNGCQKVLSETAQATSIAAARWQHLSLAFREESYGDRKLVTIITILDGCFQRETTMEYTAPNNSQPKGEAENSIGLGHVVTVDDLEVLGGRWQLGNLMLFKDCQMTKHMSFHIFALGPECCTLSKCDCSDQSAVYYQFITDNIVRHSGLSQDVLTGNHSIYFQHLRENLVLSYSPQNVTMFSLYPTPYSSTASAPTGLKGLLRPTPQTRSSFNPLMHQPETAHARLVTDVAPHIHRGLHMALDEIGGFPVFLFLFAQMVEKKGTPSQQAEALKLLFSVIQNNSKYAKGFLNMGGHDLVVKVMVSHPCHTGLEILKVILDVCLSQSTLYYSRSAHRYCVDNESTALIRDGQVVTNLFLAWRVWERAPEGVWCMGFETLEVLLRDGHPFQGFNVQQLQNAGVIEKILLICLERLQDSLPALPIPVCRSMINIVGKLVGSPPDIHNIMNICDFLMLAHPAASTFVCHGEDDFYFRHKWMSQSAIDLARITLKDPAPKEQGDVLTDNTAVEQRLDEQKTSTPMKPKKNGKSVNSSNIERGLDKLEAEEKIKEKKMVKRGVFNIKKASSEKDTGLKSHSLPSTGFWNRSENTTTATHDTTSKDTSESINRLIKRGVMDAFKSLASSYPQSVEWRKPTTVQRLFQDPKEMNIKDGLEANVSSDIVSSQSDCDEAVSRLKSAHVAVRKPRIRSYSENERPVNLASLYTSSTDNESKESESDNQSAPLIISRKKFRKHHTRCPSDPTAQLLTDKSAENNDDIPKVNSNSSQSDTNRQSPLNSTEFYKYTPLGKISPSDDEESTHGQDGELENDDVSPNKCDPIKDETELNSEIEPLHEPIVLPVETTTTGTRKISTSSSFVVVDGETPFSPAEKEDDWLIFSTDGSSIHNTSTIGRQVDAEMEDGEQGLVFLYSRLLELLSRIIVKMPQDDFVRITESILKPQILIVMAHHCSAEVRAGVIKVLDIYLLRMSKELEDSFLKMQGFHLLACQLHQHETSVSIVEACFTIMLGKPHQLQDDIAGSMLSELRPIQQMAVVPVIALLENSINEAPLCHNMLCLLGQVFTSIPSMVLPMLSNGLVEALSNTLSGVVALQKQCTEPDEQLTVLVEGIHQFFCCVVEKCFSDGDVVSFQHLEDLFHILCALEHKQADLYGSDSEEVAKMKTLQSICFRAVFDYISELLGAQSGILRKSTITGAVGSFLAKLPLPSTSSFSEEDEYNSSDDFLRASHHESLGWPSLGSPNLLSPPEKKPGGNLRSRSLPGTNKESSSLRRRSYTLDPVRRPRVQSSLDIFTAGLFSSKKGNQGLTQGDLTERLKKIVMLATDFVLFTTHLHHKKVQTMSRPESVVEVNLEIVPVDVDFSRFLLEFLLKGIITGLERSIFQRKTLGMSVMWQAKDILRVQFSRLVAGMLSLDQDLTQRVYALELILNEPKLKEVLKITHNIKSTGPKLASYVYELQSSHLNDLSSGQREQAVELTNMLEQLGVQTFRLGRKLSRNEKVSMQEDKSVWNVELVRERSVWLRFNEEAKKRIVQKMVPMSKRLVAQALEVTQSVTKAQNGQRKKFLEHVKRQMSHRVQVKKAWQQLIQQLTHERALWHCADSYPKSWQLDPTEGPCRVRKRLQRCHLGIDAKFLTKPNQHKLEAEQFDPPLAYLFEDDNLLSDSAALIYKLHTSQNIQYTCMCTHVTPSAETIGELLIGQNDLYFVADEAILDANYTQVLLGNKDMFLTLAHEDLKGIQKRWFQLRDTAIEIFLTNGKTCLLAFETTKEQEELYSRISNLELPNLISDDNLAAVQQLWTDGKMTNFEYLTRLNRLAGRSLNDLMQYPIFPFIIAKYEEAVLDLEDETTFRNLAKPIAVQHKHREQRYVENYKCLEAEQKRYADTGFFEYHPDPYHYGSHYSNSGCALHFLVRLPPFTQMFLDYQDQSFDLPDRTFHAMETSWRLASVESSTDVKELIPEFFFLPEFLSNGEGYDFGKRQTGERVSNVTLPQWCLDNPRLFVMIHRQALESSYVSQHLASWIDLVFGFRQQGRAAVEAVNVFHPATYFGVDVDAIDDPVRRRAVKTMVKTYGQTPRQLFRSPHPVPLPTAAANRGLERGRSADRDKFPPMSTVRGLRWGEYVGSPDDREPSLTWTQKHKALLASLVALPTGGVFGLKAFSCLVVMYSKEKGVTNVTTVDVLWAAIMSWGHPDSIIRIKNRKDLPAVNFLHWSTEETVTCCASVPDCRLLFIGSTSGVISVVNTKFNQNKQSHLQVFGHKTCLYGHSGAITTFSVCSPFSILVSASRDGTLIIWDLNRLSYVRSISDHHNPVHTVAVSDTLGDIASVSHTDHGSCLMLHTVNGEHVKSIECEELVLCLTFSTAPEGRSVNVIAGGLSSGSIRLWSSWDLHPVRDICSEKFSHPIVSVVFTHDCKRLFAANADGTVAMWEKTSSTRPKDVLFIPFV